jgi:hypothetical protein
MNAVFYGFNFKKYRQKYRKKTKSPPCGILDTVPLHLFSPHQVVPLLHHGFGRNFGRNFAGV